MLWFIIPALNEKEGLPRLASAIASACRRIGRSYHVVIVDDGSTDGTDLAAPGIFGSGLCTVKRHAVNEGPGVAVFTGIRHVLDRAADDDIVITIEADGTSDLAILDNMTNLIDRGNDLVLASPYAEGGGITGTSFYRVALSASANFLAKWILCIGDIKTYSSFYRAHRISLLRRAYEVYGLRLIAEKGFGYAMEILTKFSRLDARIVEVPMVLDASRRIGTSRMRVTRTIAAYFRIFFKLGLVTGPPARRQQDVPSQRRISLYGTFAALALFVACVAHPWLFQGLDYDEHTEWKIGQSTSSIWRTFAVDHANSNTPGYSCVLLLTRSIFGDGEWALRLPSVLSGVACIILLIALIENRKVGVLAGILLASNNFFLYWSSVARPHLVGMAFAMAALYCYKQWYSGHRRGLLTLFFSVLAVSTVMTYLLLPIAMAAMALFPGPTTRRQSWIMPLIVTSCALCGALLFWHLVLGGIGQTSGGVGAPSWDKVRWLMVPLVGIYTLFGQIPLFNVLGGISSWSDAVAVIVTLVALVLTFLPVVSSRTARSEWFSMAIPWCAWTGWYAALVIFRPVWLAAHYVLLSWPFACGAIAMGPFLAPHHKWRRALSWTGVAVILILALRTDALFFTDDGKRSSLRDASSFAGGGEGVNTLILHSHRSPVGYYLPQGRIVEWNDIPRDIGNEDAVTLVYSNRGDDPEKAGEIHRRLEAVGMQKKETVVFPAMIRYTVEVYRSRHEDDGGGEGRR